MKTHIFLDADSLYFRICFKTKNKKEIRLNINRKLDEIHGACFMGDMKIAVKGKGNWRKDYYSDYKMNRKELEPDMKEALGYAHEYLLDRHGAIPADGMEADDLVSIWAYEAREMEEPYIVAGIDKDLLQIPGNHYNFIKETVQFVDDDEANMNLMLQCLTGDNSDNIPGIRGIGPAKAKKYLSGTPIDDRWDRVKKHWVDSNAGDPYVSWRLLKMLTNWDELNEIQEEIKSKTSQCESSVEPKGIQEV